MGQVKVRYGHGYRYGSSLHWIQDGEVDLPAPIPPYYVRPLASRLRGSEIHSLRNSPHDIIIEPHADINEVRYIPTMTYVLTPVNNRMFRGDKEEWVYWLKGTF